MSNSFKNLKNQLEQCSSKTALPLEEALCLMDMVGKDILSEGCSIDQLHIDNWKRLRTYLLSLTGTLNRIYAANSTSIAEKTRPIPQKSLDSLQDAEAALRELERQESGLRDQVRELESIVSKQKLKDQLVTQLINEKTDLEQRISRLKSVDLTRLEQERDALALSAEDLCAQISRQKDQNLVNMQKLQSDREQLSREKEQSADLERQCAQSTQALHQAHEHRAHLDAQLRDGKARLQSCMKETRTLEQELEALTAELGIHDGVIAGLMGQLEPLRKQMAELEDFYQACRDEIKMLNERIPLRRAELKEQTLQKQMLLQEITNTESDLARLNTRLEEANAAKSRLQAQLDAGNELLKADHAKSAQLEEALSDQSALCSRLEEDIRTLEKQLAAQNDLVAGLQARLGALKDQHLSMDEAHRSLNRQVAGLEQDVAVLEQENAQLYIDQTNLNHTLTQKRAAYAQLQAEYEAGKTEEAELDADTAQLTGQKQALDGTILKLTGIRQTLLEDTDRLEQERSCLDAAVKQLQTRKAQLPGQIQTVTEARAACEAACTQLQEQLDQLNYEREQSDLHKAGLEAELETARSNKAHLDQQCAQLQELLDQLSGVQQQRDETARLQEEAEDNLRETRDTLQSLKDTIAAHRQETAALNEQAEGAQAELSAAAALLDQAHTEHDALVRDLNATRQSTETTNARRLELQSQLDQAAAALKTAEQTAQQTEQDLASANSAYQEMDTAILLLGRQLQKQIEANTDYHDNHLVPARQKLSDAQADQSRMTEEVAALETDLKQLEDRCRSLTQEINQTNTLINAEIVNKEQQEKKFRQALEELNQKRSAAEKEAADQQARLTALNLELSRLTSGIIQPMLDAIAKAEKTLREKGSEEVLQQYQQLQQEKETLVCQVEETLAKLPALEQELQQCYAERDAAQSELTAKQTSIQEVQAKHDQYRSELAMLSSEEQVQKLQAVQDRLTSLTEIRQELIDISTGAGFGMEYTDILEKTIRRVSDTACALQAQIEKYTQTFSEKLVC